MAVAVTEEVETEAEMQVAVATEEVATEEEATEEEAAVREATRVGQAASWAAHGAR